MSPKVQRALVLGLIFAGVLLAAFFGLRAVFAFREFRRHGPPPLPHLDALNEQAPETNVDLVRDWMTIPYIAKTYQIHPRSFSTRWESPRVEMRKKAWRN